MHDPETREFLKALFSNVPSLKASPRVAGIPGPWTLGRADVLRVRDLSGAFYALECAGVRPSWSQIWHNGKPDQEGVCGK